MTFDELTTLAVQSAFSWLGLSEDEITDESTGFMKTCVQDAIYFVHERRGLEINLDNIDTYVVNRQSLIAQMASAVYNKIGVNGQTNHNENGINRTYDSSGYPVDLVARIIPMVRSYGTTESE